MEGRPRIGRLPLGRIAGGTLRGGPLQLRVRGAALPAAIRRELAAVRQKYLHDAHQRLVAQLVQRLERCDLVSGLQCLDDAQARNACDARRAALQILAHMKQARRHVHDHRNGKNDHRGHGDDHSQLLLDGKIGKPTKQGMLLRWRALGGWPCGWPPPRIAALLRMSAFAVKSIGGKSDANHVASKTGGTLQLSRLCRIGLCAGPGNQASGLRPIERRTGVGLAPRRDIAVADETGRRKTRIGRAKRRDDTCKCLILQWIIGQGIGALEFYSNGEVVAGFTAAIARPSRVPGAVGELHILGQSYRRAG